MTFCPAALLLLLFAPLAASAQSVGRVSDLRSKAVAEGSVAVKVITRAVAAAPSAPAARTAAQRSAIQLAQQKLLLDLIPRGLVEGNEIRLEPDGSFTMRVLPEGIDRLAGSGDVAALALATTPAVNRP
jgi:parvulin-like peptidyl-prolyl isomerase